MVPFPKIKPKDYHVAVLDHMVLACLAHLATVLGLVTAAGFFVSF